MLDRSATLKSAIGLAALDKLRHFGSYNCAKRLGVRRPYAALCAAHRNSTARAPGSARAGSLSSCRL